MSFWKWLLGSQDDRTATSAAQIQVEEIGSLVNPATGLPMIGGMSGIDAGGSMYGTDSHSSSTSWHSDTSAGSGIGSSME